MSHATSIIPAVEEWKDIQGYEGAYQVSTFGRVRSLDRKYYKHHKDGRQVLTKHRGRILRQSTNNDGRYLVCITYNHTTRRMLINRLVAIAFLPNPNNLPEVNHKDENPSNNHVDNLEWCDHLYNIRYGTGISRNLMPRRKCIEQLTLDGQHIAYHFGLRELCRATGICRRSIQRCLQNKAKYKSAYGYMWRYANRIYVSDWKYCRITQEHRILRSQDRSINRPVIQYTKDCVEIARFNTITQAAQSVCVTIQAISNCLRGISKTCAGYIWKYE